MSWSSEETYFSKYVDDPVVYNQIHVRSATLFTLISIFNTSGWKRHYEHRSATMTGHDSKTQQRPDQANCDINLIYCTSFEGNAANSKQPQYNSPIKSFFRKEN